MALFLQFEFPVLIFSCPCHVSHVGGGFCHTHGLPELQAGTDTDQLDTEGTHLSLSYSLA